MSSQTNDCSFFVISCANFYIIAIIFAIKKPTKTEKMVAK